MTHEEAIKKLAELTNDAFCINSEVWRHVNSNPQIEFRVSVCADNYPDHCIAFCSKTLDGAVEKMVEFLSQNKTTVPQLDASLATVA